MDKISQIKKLAEKLSYEKHEELALTGKTSSLILYLTSALFVSFVAGKAVGLLLSFSPVGAFVAAMISLILFSTMVWGIYKGDFKEHMHAPLALLKLKLGFNKNPKVKVTINGEEYSLLVKDKKVYLNNFLLKVKKDMLQSDQESVDSEEDLENLKYLYAKERDKHFDKLLKEIEAYNKKNVPTKISDFSKVLKAEVDKDKKEKIDLARASLEEEIMRLYEDKSEEEKQEALSIMTELHKKEKIKSLT